MTIEDLKQQKERAEGLIRDILHELETKTEFRSDVVVKRSPHGFVDVKIHLFFI